MKDFFNIDKHIKNNKYLSWQVGFYNKSEERQSPLNIQFRLSRKQDHAGLTFDIEILGLYSLFNIYDNRHWCYKCKKFEDQECRDNKCNI